MIKLLDTALTFPKQCLLARLKLRLGRFSGGIRQIDKADQILIVFGAAARIRVVDSCLHHSADLIHNLDVIHPRWILSGPSACLRQIVYGDIQHRKPRTVHTEDIAVQQQIGTLPQIQKVIFTGVIRQKPGNHKLLVPVEALGIGRLLQLQRIAKLSN